MNKYKDLRNLFTNYFVNLGHKSLPSSSLIPYEDPSLLFVNSGMVQFKNIFLGLENPKFKTVTTIQKSLRAGGKHNDLDNVGYTSRHQTFFEMLGNFSFGEYFKENAIEYAWNFLTKEIKLDKNRLYFTVFHTDDEAFNIWKKITGFSDDKIIKISTNDNFWSMGETGPCGPSSEIFYDYGDSVFGGPPGTENADGDRFVEIWNLVFMQFNQEVNKPLEKLTKPCIDTGMGLERLVSVIEGKTNNFDTSFFSDLILNSRYILQDNKPENLIAHRVIADHLRSISFLIADGILPSNEGRGYVLRRIMRRGMRYLHQICPNDKVMYKLFDKLNDLMSYQYPELSKNAELIKNTIKTEENTFQETLSKGMKIILDEFKVSNINEIHYSKIKNLSGNFAFKLYDTYGFPIDMTLDIMKRVNGKVDIEGFENAMQEQKNRSKANTGSFGDKKDDKIWFEIAKNLNPTELLEDMQNPMRIMQNSTNVRVLKIIKNGEIMEEILKNSTKSTDEIWVLFDKTCFYPQSGGQAGDFGAMKNKTSEEVLILDTKKVANTLVIHKISDINFDIKNECEYEIIVNKNRLNSQKNHTATHLLQASLKKVLGNDISQKGSEVTNEKLRFDFNFNTKLTQLQIEEIENIMNNFISQDLKINSIIDIKENIEKHNAIANFQDKYGEEIRIIKIENNKNLISSELCGGMHVNSTKDIQFFKIISEKSIGSGLRRIEALTGVAAINYLSQKEKILLQIQNKLQCSDNEISSKIEDLILNNIAMQKQISNIEINQYSSQNFEKIPYKNFNFCFVNLKNFNLTYKNRTSKCFK